MSKTLFAPDRVRAFPMPSPAAQPGHFQRWLKSLMAARERRAARAVRRHLERLLPAGAARRTRVGEVAGGRE